MQAGYSGVLRQTHSQITCTINCGTYGKKGETDMIINYGTVTTDRFSMDYCCFGRGPRNLVIIPGLNVQSVMPLADAIAEAYGILTEDFRIYVFDRRKDPPKTYRVSDMACDTAEALAFLNIEKTDIFGTSQGGMIAMELATEFQEHVNSVILGSSSACVSDADFEIFDKWISLAKSGDVKKLFLTLMEDIYPKDSFENMRELLLKSAESVTGEDLARFVIMAEGMRGFDVREKLSRVKIPALVIGSTDDRVFSPDSSPKIAACMKNSRDCRLYMYDAFGHIPYDFAPDYKERMLDFLKTQK